MKQKMMTLIICLLMTGNLSFPVTKACDNETSSTKGIVVQDEKRKPASNNISAELFPFASILFNIQNL